MAKDYTSKLVSGEGETAEILQARDFVRLIEVGVTPLDAAKNVGSTPSQMGRNPHVLELIEGLKQYQFTPEQQKWLVMAKANQGLLTAQTDRDQQGWAKIIAMNPEVGLGSNDNPTVVVNISEEIRNLPATDMEWDKEHNK